MWSQLTTVMHLNPEDWGWQLRDGVLTPVAMDIQAAPDNQLQIVRCKCKIETRNLCSSLVCPCRKHGLQCVASCKNRCGVSYGNPSSVTYCSSDAETDSASEGEVALCEAIEDPGDDLNEDLMEYFIPWVDEDVVGNDI
jgi:hypothetical protein